MTPHSWSQVLEAEEVLVWMARTVRRRYSPTPAFHWRGTGTGVWTRARVCEGRNYDEKPYSLELVGGRLVACPQALRYLQVPPFDFSAPGPLAAPRPGVGSPPTPPAGGGDL